MKKLIPVIVVIFSAFFASGPYVSALYGQTAPVPAEYQDLYAALDSNLSSFENTVKTSWDGSTYPVVFSAALKSADSSLGPALLAPYHYAGVLMELDSLKALGVKAVTVSIDFPVLYPGFYSSQADYQQYLDFYTQLASDIRARNMKLIVETGPVCSQTGYSSLSVSPFYNSLTLDQYENGRMQVAQTIALNLKPDYLSVITEPDTEAIQSGKSELGTVSGSTALLNTILTGLQQAGVQGVEVGAGVGSWIPSYTSYVESFASTSVDYIDMHVYPINYDYLPRLQQIADLAGSYGKPVAISEAWLSKIRDSELLTLPADDAFARDPFSFWAPLDKRFLTVLFQFANENHLQFFSPFWTERLHAYVDYDTTSGMTPSQIFLQGAIAASQQIAAGQYTSTGLGYAASLIAPPDTTAPTTPTGLFGGAPLSGAIQINLIWNASTDDTGVAGYNVIRDGVPIGTAAGLYYIDKTAAPSTTHTYQISAYDVSGNVSGLSDPLTATVPADVTPPTVPAGLSAQAVSASQVNLSWTASTDNVAVAYYTVYRNGSQVATTTATSYSDAGAAALTSYSYTVSATDTSGNSSALSVPASATTSGGDTAAPSVPTNLTGKSIHHGNVALSWSGSSDNVGVAGYQLYRGTTQQSLAPVATTPGTQYTDTGLIRGMTYYYAVAAYDQAGNTSALSATISVRVRFW